MFPGFTEDTVRFFLDIRFHNETGFMHAHHDEYVEKVQKPFYALIEDLSPGMLKIDPDMETRPVKCLSRINRDTRYTKDKSPYRDHHWIAFRKSGVDKNGRPFFWFEFGPDRLSWGLGLWGENKEALDVLRARIEKTPDVIADLVFDLDRHRLVESGTENRRLYMPPSVPDALQSLYRKKTLYFERLNPRYTWAGQSDLPKRLMTDFRRMAPMYRLLDECVAEALAVNTPILFGGR
ncbi:MAG: DUF2461 domain-containing protein [Clostridia bacterium]|nr:DUF2461 domain-containing protein [Clostridia bacterium]